MLRLFAVLVLFATSLSAAEPLLEKIDLFEAKKDGFALYRIPGIIITAKGTVLTYCEARKNTGSDWGEIEVHLRRSTDGGKTWAPARKIAHTGDRIEGNPRKKEGGEHEQTVNNPVAIADKDGTVHFLYCLNYARCFYMRSTDDGLTFSAPVEITASFEPFRPRCPWNVLATGPGHGIQLRKTGRLVVPVWLAYGKNPGDHGPSMAATIYSDNGGHTWKAGDIAVPNEAPFDSPNETAAAELSDGRVMLNSRTAKSPPNRRTITISPNGATEWSAPRFDPALWEPVCMAGLISIPQSPGTLVFSNPHNLKLDQDGKEIPSSRAERRNLSIKLSRDDGQTWPLNKVLEPGNSAYSDLAVLPDDTILCFYEQSGKLTLARLNIEWLQAKPTDLQGANGGRIPPMVAPKRLIKNDDGHYGFYSGKLKDAEAIRKVPQSLRGSQVGIYQWGITVGTKVNYPSRIAELCGEGISPEALATVREGDRNVATLLQKLRADGVDTLQSITEGCHAEGIRCFASVRMNPVYPLKAKGWTGDSMAQFFNSKFWWDHPDLRIHLRDGREHPALSYAYPEVRKRVLGIVREALERDVDGIDLDFLRHPPFVGYEAPLVKGYQERYHLDPKTLPEETDERWLKYRAESMTQLVREIRAAIDEAGAKRGRPLGLSARVDHTKHLLWGCDIDVWLQEHLLDILVVSQYGLGGWNFDLRPFVAKAKGTGCQIFIGEEATISGRDTTPEDGAKLKPGEKEPITAHTMSEDMWFDRARHWYAQGADGIHIFNGAPPAVASHLGDPPAK